MAQHISIINSDLTKLKGFQKVSESFYKKIQRGFWTITGSLKFEEISSPTHKINPADRVFMTHRIVNGKKEMFELHFDTKKQKLLDIFLVS
jgi:hypothetical protein